MQLLLDTHALFWSISDEGLLSPTALAAIRSSDNDVVVSVGSLWEMAIKVGLGKWPPAATLVTNFEQEMAANGFRILGINVDHARESGLMRSLHRDPFDRLLAAQARIEHLTIVTADIKLQGLGAAWLW